MKGWYTIKSTNHLAILSYPMSDRQKNMYVLNLVKILFWELFFLFFFLIISFFF